LVRTPVAPVPLSSYRVSPAWERVLGAVRGNITLPGLATREWNGGAELEDVYRAIYLGVSCGLVLAR
jgi:hypothetical protein